MYVTQYTFNGVLSLIAGAAIGGGIVYFASRVRGEKEVNEMCDDHAKEVKELTDHLECVLKTHQEEMATLKASHESEKAALVELYEEEEKEIKASAYQEGYDQGIADAADAADKALAEACYNPDGLKYAIIDGSDPDALNDFFEQHPDAVHVQQPGGKLPKGSPLMWFGYKP